ncbi:hypothetical protein K3495_g8336 [Podosphaera aphanis]|nr:hypothetical protein K3495_g8336 [Podosphaera aphanis]
MSKITEDSGSSSAQTMPIWLEKAFRQADIPIKHAAKIDPTLWGKTVDYELSPSMLDSTTADTHILYCVCEYEENDWLGSELWEHFYEHFCDWTSNAFPNASKEVLTTLRDCIRDRGIYVSTASGHSMAKHLGNTIDSGKDGAFHFWSPEEVEAVQRARRKFRRRLRNVSDLYADLTDPGPTAEEAREAARKHYAELKERRLQVLLTKHPLSEKPTTEENEKDKKFDDELPPDPIQFNRPNNLPSPRQNTSISQCFSSDASKYGGDKYEAIDGALFIFHRNCDINDVPYPARGHFFRHMLKGEALNFFSNELCQLTEIDKIVLLTREYFQPESSRHQYLQEWESVSLQHTIQQHPDKSKADCFDIMLQRLLKIKKLLPSDMQIDSHLRLKL